MVTIVFQNTISTDDKDFCVIEGNVTKCTNVINWIFRKHITDCDISAEEKYAFCGDLCWLEKTVGFFFMARMISV